LAAFAPATLVALGVTVLAVGRARPRDADRAAPRSSNCLCPAEALPLPNASVDAVLAGPALHWFDMDVAGPEIGRVLAPGGMLACLWNVVDNRIDWVAELERVSAARRAAARFNSTTCARSMDTPTAQEFPGR
jgi:SAM-dependent methyltransferase